MLEHEWRVCAWRTLRRIAGRATLAILVTWAGGCAEQSKASAQRPQHNIILIVIDTLRADHLGCYGYFRDTSPNIDAFATQAILFERVYTPMATTLPAHASLFTGLYPLEHGCLANVAHGGRAFHSRPGGRSFAELARANGYTTAAFVSATPLKRVCGLDAGFDLYQQPIRAQHKAGLTTDAALDWLDLEAHEPFLLFVHYFDPHMPYRPPPPYRTMFQTDAGLEAYLAERQVPGVVQPGRCRGGHPTVTRTATNLYDGEIRYTDEQVGRLLDSLRQRGLWDKSVIIVAADHGEGLNQHGWPQHGRTWNEQVHVPLLIRFPGPRDDLPKRFAAVVSLIDVLPTVLGRLKPSWAEAFLKQARGVDVLAPDFQERPVLAQRSGRDCGDEGGPLYALTARQWRYHYVSETEELLFDRLADPHELRDVSASSPAVAGELRRQTLELTELLRKQGERLGSDKGAPIELNPELRRQMEALGYVGEAASGTKGEQSSTTKPASRPAKPKRSAQEP